MQLFVLFWWWKCYPFALFCHYKVMGCLHTISGHRNIAARL